MVYAATVGLAVYANLVGLGRLEKHLNQWQWAEAMKFYIIWILMYVVALALVKSSVCITIQRIASTKTPLRITIWVLLAITWASFSITFVGTLAYCQPVRTIWTPTLVLSGEGKCAPVRVFVYIGHVGNDHSKPSDFHATITNAYTSHCVHDLHRLGASSCAGYFVVEYTDEKTGQTASIWTIVVCFIVSFLSVCLIEFVQPADTDGNRASIITMIRIPYVNRFEGMTDLQCTSSLFSLSRL